MYFFISPYFQTKNSLRITKDCHTIILKQELRFSLISKGEIAAGKIAVNNTYGSS